MKTRIVTVGAIVLVIRIALIAVSRTVIGFACIVGGIVVAAGARHMRTQVNSPVAAPSAEAVDPEQERQVTDWLSFMAFHEPNYTPTRELKDLFFLKCYLPLAIVFIRLIPYNRN